MLLYKALMQSQLKYLIIYGSIRTKNKVLNNIFNLPIMYPTISLYEDVVKSVLAIMGTYKLQLLLYVFKCINNIGYHTIQFWRNQQLIETRNRPNLLVAWYRLEITKLRIEYILTREYNNLTLNLKNINKISLFKTRLKNIYIKAFLNFYSII